MHFTQGGHPAVARMFRHLGLHRRGWHVWPACLLFMALFLRALVPLGYMPAQPGERDSSWHLVVCTPNGFVDLSEGKSASNASEALADVSPDTPAEPGHAQSVCGFSVSVWQALIEGFLLALVLMWLLQLIRPVVRAGYASPIWAPCVRICAPRAPPRIV